MKKSWAAIGSIALAITMIVAGCGQQNSASVKPDSGATRTLKIANYFATDHPQNVALREKFKPMVEQESNGALQVEIYDNSQLGAEQEFYDGVRNGTIEMGIPGMIMQSSIEKLGVPEWPFLFRDYEHAKKVLNGPLGEEMLAELESKHGVHALAWSANGFRMFSSRDALQSMADFQGLRMRMPNIEHYLDLGKALGMTVTPMPISEVFTALEQKVVDGQDNPIATLRASGWYEVQSYVLESNHMFSPNLYLINSNLWNSLTGQQRSIIEKAAKASADYEWELMQKSYEADKQFLMEKGIKFITPSEDFLRQMEQAVEPLYQRYYQTYPWAEDLVKRIRAEK
ncbi:TRAP transporter substrate-binding protein [Brevibacillus fulvus]|uniref:Tripartite ATP-independent transporter DctP family solute receptor n=1 Tax=Brevibacillus fulvus TaxID=1125967 RepID=A0A939BNT3_9BACL|nr:TRAP transporter substrate-binding protein [Brevibacillus fulvus]MBM7589605.1 tripartite ATP-independent transporter DctP family solute receptor [Brevibacillus fulvus]